MLKYLKNYLLIIVMPVVFCLTNANATLIDHGNGLIYDNDLNITWLSNSNLAETTMTWDAARTWAANLSHAGFDDWRLPSALHTDGSGLLPTSSSQAYSDDIKGEMRNLFDELGGTLRSTTTQNFNSNAALFSNIVTTFNPEDAYWTNMEGSISGRAYYFAFSNGGQWQKNKDGSNRHGLGLAWAVHDGELGSPVPEPATMLLLGFGLLGIAGISRKSSL